MSQLLSSKKMELFSTLLFAAVASALATQDAELLSIRPRIVGGDIATPHQFPYTVGIRLTQIMDGDIAFYSWCGGSLISENIVLTAAHCLKPTVAATVYLGAHDIEAIEEPGRLEVFVQPDTFIIHEGFNPESYTDDIALIILPEKVQLNENIRKVDLPSIHESDIQGQMAITSGWGREGDKKPLSNVLRFIQRKILRSSYCAHFYGPITSNQLCVDGYRKTICSGDSGGPLVLKNKDGSPVIVGLTSFGTGFCQKDHPTVFTKVASYLDWIKEKGGVLSEK